MHQTKNHKLPNEGFSKLFRICAKTLPYEDRRFQDCFILQQAIIAQVATELQHYRKLAPLTVGAIWTIKSCGEPGRQGDRQLWRDTHILLVSSSEAFLSRGCSLFRTGIFPRTLKWGFSHFSSTKINKQRLSEGGSPRLLSDVLKGLSPIAFHSAKNAVFNSQKNRSVGFRRLFFEEPTTRSAQTGPGSAPSPD